MVHPAPANIKKSGTAFALAISVAILAASEQIEIPEAIEKYVIMGVLIWMERFVALKVHWIGIQA